ncbi:peroxidase 44-like [Abrus precatorius]|uniref:Peroxidase n=1 Tax=Abrus precatorius TaxID=3816 RepID=A0A8B8LQP2_ABRPR|nr:peroxidase 44-like [Abrus precatorius]
MKNTIILIFFCFVLPFTFADLRDGFYSLTCPKAETIVHEVVQRRFNQDRSIVAAFLRMHFHDCFVRGCDASILIDPTSTRTSEKNAGPNRTVRGYDVIDEAKTLLEQECPSTVSCADIITLATRDAVALAGGIRYSVPTGRRDGLLSDPSQVNLPAPSLSVSRALQFFTAKGLTLEDMVTLLGGHTVGFAHCSVFQNRLSSFKGTLDPTMDPDLDAKLVQICGSLNKPPKGDPLVFLDQNSPFKFDSEFYDQMLRKRGVLHIDQELALDPLSKDMVANFAADGNSFQQKFANAMIKMGNIGVLVGSEGEIRKNCREFNFPL